MPRRSEFILIFVFILGFVFFSCLVCADPGWNSSATGKTYNASEDTLYTYNFSANVTNSEANMTFSFYDINGYNYLSYNLTSLFPWIGINNGTGIMTINATRDNQTGLFTIQPHVQGTLGGSNSIFYFNVTPVNDAPYFTNLINFTFNATELFSQTLQATDEENNIPYTFNATFMSCSTANWSTRLSANCNLFNVSNLVQYWTNSTAVFLNFTPGKDDVGSYIINFTVTDLNNLIKPYNASTSKVVNFTVLDKNTPPIFTNICDGKTSATENTLFSCYVNVTDLGEENNVTFSSNSVYTGGNAVSYPAWFVSNNVSSVSKTTSYKGYVLVSFTPSNLQVGNWSINISSTDSGYPGASILTNYTILNFYVSNVNDSVSLASVSNQSTYNTTGIVTFYVNGSDNDLLIPDKTAYNESLTFSLNDTGWINITSNNTVNNVTIAKIQFDSSNRTGLTWINLSVHDTNNYSKTTKVFFVNITGNSPPAWNVSTATNYLLTEGSGLFLNLSGNVSDVNGDAITFWYTNDTSFPSFSLNSTGNFNFTSVEEDVGYHNVTIYANDSKISSPLSFNVTISNVNDAPNITAVYGTGLSVGAGYNMNLSEGNVTNIYVNVTDSDLRITQKNFYNENLTLNLVIAGPDSSLFNFIKADYNLSYPDLNVFGATFTPVLSDVGNYSIFMNVTDSLGLSSSVKFNMTVLKVKQKPTLQAVQNLSYAVGDNFYLRLNATDRDDGTSGVGNGNFTFAYINISGTGIFNSSTFNSSTGEFNVTLTSIDSGIHEFNVSVNNSANLMDYKPLWLYVYDAPAIIFNSSSEFDLAENATSNLVFRANHSVADNLTYEFYLNNTLRYNISYYGNGTNLTWSFTPNFNDETYGFKNLTLVVINPLFKNLNVTKTWNANITHSNSSINFSGTIPDTQTTYDKTVSIKLSDYFSDSDYFDSHYNYTASFSLGRSSSSIGYNFNNATWMLTFNSGVTANEVFNVTINNSFSSAASNNFAITFTAPSATSTPASSSNGGGGGVRYYAIKVITPGDVNISQEGYIEIPFVIQNTGQIALQGITLTSQVIYNNLNTQDVRVVIANSSVDNLGIGTFRNMTMKVYTDVSKSGRYRVYIYANVTAPVFSDWGEFYIELGKANETEAGDSIAFTSKIISENPKCLELTELLKEAQKYIDSKDYNSAVAKSKEAVQACEKLISQETQKPQQNEIKIVGNYAIIATIAILVLWGVFYFYKRARFNKPKLDDYIEVK